MLVFEWMLILTISTTVGKAIAITTVMTEQDCHRIGKQWKNETDFPRQNRYTCARKLKELP